jgi:glycosyltransferase involved in cell wall biosynthesis
MAFVSEALVDRPVEGAQVLARTLAAHFASVHGAFLVGAHSARADVKLRGRLFGLRALRALRRHRPEAVVYLPANGLTTATLVRAMLIRWFVRPATLEVAVLQVHEPRRGLLRKLARQISFVVATESQSKELEALDARVSLVQPRVAPSKVSSMSPADARHLHRLGEGRVFLHVGHARRGRNLRALEPLCDVGTLVIALSPYSDEEPDALPADPRTVVLRGPSERIGELYRAADVYVFPTTDAAHMIGTPLSVFEALANGTRVVARRSEALARWDGLAGLELCDTDGELVAAATSFRRVEIPKYVDPACQCKGDFAVCRGPEHPTG